MEAAMLLSHLRKDGLEKAALTDLSTVDRDRRRITQYDRNNKTNPKELGAAHNAPAARSSIRSRDTAPYFLRPRARPAPHSQVGQNFESLAPGRVPQANPNTCCLAGQAIEPEARGRAPQRNPNIIITIIDSNTKVVTLVLYCCTIP